MAKTSLAISLQMTSLLCSIKQSQARFWVTKFQELLSSWFRARRVVAPISFVCPLESPQTLGLPLRRTHNRQLLPWLNSRSPLWPRTSRKASGLTKRLVLYFINLQLPMIQYGTEALPASRCVYSQTKQVHNPYNHGASLQTEKYLHPRSQ